MSTLYQYLFSPCTFNVLQDVMGSLICIRALMACLMSPGIVKSSWPGLLDPAVQVVLNTDNTSLTEKISLGNRRGDSDIAPTTTQFNAV